MECSFCQKSFKNGYASRSHERFCQLNPNRVESPFKGLKNKPSWNSGKTVATDIRVKCKQETKEKLKIACNGLCKTEEAEKIRVEKIREKIKKRYADGWESTAGRCKKIDYESPIAGKIKLDGSWELKVAKHLDNLGLTWERNKKRFDYVRMDGKNCTYQPDFYVHEWHSYLEVKGYETELDRCKWSQFKEPLIIWRKKEIQILED
jgi:hypothetical protein